MDGSADGWELTAWAAGSGMPGPAIAASGLIAGGRGGATMSRSAGESAVLATRGGAAAAVREAVGSGELDPLGSTPGLRWMASLAGVW
jgi:hypothetical protein